MGSYSLVIILMLLFSGFFSGMEIAFVSSSRLKHQLDVKRNILPARVLSIFYKNPSRFIGALLLGNNVALVVYGIAMAGLLEPLIVGALPAAMHTEVVVLLFQTLISTLIILITAEFFPKILFRINPNAILKFFALPVWLFYYLFYPLILLYIGLSEFILRKVFRMNLSNNSYQFSAIDLEEYVKEYLPGEQQPDELDQEIQMIQNAIEFKNIKLRDCLVPRTEIKAIEINEDIGQLRSLFTVSGHSKILVYRENIDKLVGYVHAFDLFKQPQKITEVVRKVEVYPETLAANKLLSDFIKNHKSIAVVVDEFGGTSGIVTMEDVIEEIFGEIEDEHDKEDNLEKKISENEYIFSARLEIDFLNEKYKLNIPVSDEYETLSGFIIHHHESIPVQHEKIEISPFVFTVLKSRENRIEEVKLEIRDF
ncbi:MAG: hemolysin family protein [Bacteroidales bacterium]|nr:hemolysin family protein [Bacteroidales bacterium]MCF6341592.1 hemolysin family protein [Bacteroidales bacterium]